MKLLVAILAGLTIGTASLYLGPLVLFLVTVLVTLAALFSQDKSEGSR